MAEITDLVVIDDNNTGRWPENMAFSAVNNAGRADEGILARWFRDTNGSLAASGSSNAFTVTSNRTISSLVDGIVLTFKANHNITGAATLNLNGLGAKDIRRFNGNALASGDIISGQPVQVMYSASLDDWIMVSALAALTDNMFGDFSENASPGDPAANTARLYAQDDGAGATLLAWRDSAGAVTFLRKAVASIMEAASDNNHWVTPALQHRHPGHPKAGGNFNGTGTPAFRAGDYGMGAITDNGTGNYTLALDTAFADTNYWCTTFGRYSANRLFGLHAQDGDVKTTSSFQVRSSQADDGAAPSDTSEGGITLWGDYV